MYTLACSLLHYAKTILNGLNCVIMMLYLGYITTWIRTWATFYPGKKFKTEINPKADKAGGKR